MALQSSSAAEEGRRSLGTVSHSLVFSCMFPSPIGRDTYLIVVQSVPGRLTELTLLDQQQRSLGDEYEFNAWIIFTFCEEDCANLLDSLSREGAIRGQFLKEFSSLQSGHQIVSEGSECTVEHMIQCRTGSTASKAHVAVKHMSGFQIDGIEREVSMLIKCQNHQNIIGFHGLFCDWIHGIESLFLVFELATNADLLQNVVRLGRLSESKSRPLLKGIIKGLVHIHNQDIVHRDITTQNILMKKDEIPAIADFGMATLVTNEVEMSRRCGTPGFVAPEVCRGETYGVKVDLFGVGVICFFVLSKALPFTSPDGDVKRTMKLTVRGDLRLTGQTWDSKSRHLRNFLRQLMCVRPSDRLSSADALQHSFIVDDRPQRKNSIEHVRLKDDPGLTTPSMTLPEDCQWPRPSRILMSTTGSSRSGPPTPSLHPIPEPPP